ncbi:MAG: hypothetical protein ACLR6B_04865 [Blautia sp.]
MRGYETLILLVGITFLSFLLSWLSPGDAAERMLKKSGMMVTEEQLEAKREELGIDQPLLVQYKNWLVKLCKGDLGTSYKSKRKWHRSLQKSSLYGCTYGGIDDSGDSDLSSGGDPVCTAPKWPV